MATCLLRRFNVPWKASIPSCLILLLINTLFFLAACSAPPQNVEQKVEIFGRDTGNPTERSPLYTISVPDGWRITTSLNSVADTKLPLIELSYEENEQTIRLTIHNFPYTSFDLHIPPQAQIARWKKQFDTLTTGEITPQAFAGFVGFSFFGSGEGKEHTAVLGWALQLAPEHEKMLATTPLKFDKQMRSDVTIKATGPLDLIEKEQENIKTIARSFELITPLPNPL